MTTPNFTPDVPQWCDAAANEIRNTPSGELSANNIASIIAKHAPKPEATPAPAAPVDFTAADELTAHSERIGLYSATGDAAREMGGNESTTLNGIHHEVVIASLRERAEKAEALAAKWYRAFHNRHRADAGEVPATTPKWPRYFWNRKINERRVVEESRARMVDDYLACPDYIETDANGNALTQPIEQQQASGVERCSMGLSEESVNVERYSSAQASGYGSGRKWVEAADHDAAMKVKDAEIERLKCKWRVDSYEADVQNARADHMQKRAEAAEAEVAELEKALESEKQDRIGCWTNGEAKAHHLEAQLAAANERVAVVEKERDGLREALKDIDAYVHDIRHGATFADSMRDTIRITIRQALAAGGGAK